MQTNQERYQEERKKLAQERKLTVLHTAKNLFLEKGITNVSMNDIMIHAKVSRGTLYSYFSNITEIIFAIESFITKDMFAGARIIASQSFYDSVQNSLFHYIDHFYEYQDTFRFMGMFDHIYRDHNSHTNQTAQTQPEYTTYHAMISQTWQNWNQDSNTTSHKERSRLLALANMVGSYLQKLASRGSLLEKNQLISVNNQLEQLKHIVSLCIKGLKEESKENSARRI